MGNHHQVAVIKLSQAMNSQMPTKADGVTALSIDLVIQQHMTQAILALALQVASFNDREVAKCQSGVSYLQSEPSSEPISTQSSPVSQAESPQTGDLVTGENMSAPSA